MRLFVLATAAAALVLSVQAPMAAEGGAQGPYASLQLGALDLRDPSYSGGGMRLRGKHSTGYVIGGAIGYALPNDLRIEGELAFRRASLKRLTMVDDGGDGSLNGAAADASGKTKASSVMINGFYDLHLDHGITPYLGGGVGLARVDVSARQDAEGVPSVDDADTGFAWQIAAGIGFRVVDNTSLFADYRYFQTTNSSHDNSDGIRFRSTFKSHNLSVGVRFSF